MEVKQNPMQFSKVYSVKYISAHSCKHFGYPSDTSNSYKTKISLDVTLLNLCNFIIPFNKNIHFKIFKEIAFVSIFLLEIFHALVYGVKDDMLDL